MLTALANALDDATGRWILSAHDEARSELALTAGSADGAASYVIDRTFVVDGERWIIDYKTSQPAERDEAALARFIEDETATYAAQLRTYARLLRTLDGRPTRLGLYFPMLKRLHQIP